MPCINTCLKSINEPDKLILGAITILAPLLETALLRRFIYASHERQLNRTYRNRLANRGRTAQGVFWRSQSSQIARFDALLSLVHQLAPQKPVTIADIGCGYGAMLAFIKKTPAYAQTVYHGVDINRAMIAACHQTFLAENARFTIGNTPPKLVDFCVFSGTFNLTHSDDPDLGWIISLPVLTVVWNVHVMGWC